MQVSVITAARNCAATIASTIESVLSQDFADIQYIVIDGNSTDGSQDVITQYRDSIDYFVSEPDKGIADAWNKALDVATGNYILFVNGDDIVPKNYISKSLKNADEESRVIIYGDTIFFSDGLEKPEMFSAQFNPRKIIFGFGFMHTSCIFPASAFRNFRFSLSNSIAVDTEHLLWCFKNGYEFRKGDGTNFMRRGGVSDRAWKQAAIQYLGLLHEFGIVSKTRKTTLRAFIAIRQINRLLGVGKFVRAFRIQLYYLVVALFNGLFRVSPFFLKRVLMSLMGFDVSPDAAVQGGVRVFGPKRLKVGAGSMINSGVRLDNRKGITIGRNVNVAHDCRIYTLGHDVRSPSFAAVGGPVVLDDHSVLFAACMIMPNVKVGRGAVVLPGSVVTKDVPPFEIHGGNPAKKIGDRDVEPLYSPARKFWFAN